jgi:hypothetical protein
MAQLLSKNLQHQKTRNIMSKFKDQTGNTPQSSSGENTEVLERPSSPSARTDNTQTSTQTTSLPLPPMLSSELTTPPTTEKARQHALVLRVALSYFLKTGLVKRYKVLSPDGATVQKLRFEFDMSLWTHDLEPK